MGITLMLSWLESVSFKTKLLKGFLEQKLPLFYKTDGQFPLF